MADQDAEWHVPRLKILLFRFPGVRGAQDTVHQVKSEGWKSEGVEADAVVTHDLDGKVHLHEHGASIAGGAVGVTAAVALGLIGGPVILLAMVVAGGLLGGIAGHFAGRIIPAGDLREVGDAIPRDSSAYLALVEEHNEQTVTEVFGPRAESVLSLPVETEMAGVVGHELTRKLGVG